MMTTMTDIMNSYYENDYDYDEVGDDDDDDNTQTHRNTVAHPRSQLQTTNGNNAHMSNNAHQVTGKAHK